MSGGPVASFGRCVTSDVIILSRALLQSDLAESYLYNVHNSNAIESLLTLFVWGIFPYVTLLSSQYC